MMLVFPNSKDEGQRDVSHTAALLAGAEIDRLSLKLKKDVVRYTSKTESESRG